MNRILGIALVSLATLIGSAQTTPRGPQLDAEHTKWITDVLRSIEMIKVGSTRSELLVLFTTEGGLSTTSQRTYVYRLCPNIKVDVKFAAQSRAEALPTDTIVQISRPYLAWSIGD